MQSAQLYPEMSVCLSRGCDNILEGQASKNTWASNNARTIMRHRKHRGIRIVRYENRFWVIESISTKVGTTMYQGQIEASLVRIFILKLQP